MSLYKEDVYETEDLPEPEPDNTEEYFEHKEIEKVHVDILAAKKRFGNCLLDAEGADFSDSSRFKRGYKANEIFEGTGQGYECEEQTFEEKYKRICLEIKQLMAESEKQSANKTEIENLNKLLHSLVSPNLDESTKISTPQANDEPKFMTSEELEKYRSKIVSGASIQEFNEIINAILAEYNRIVEYCSVLTSNRKEYINYLKQSHQTALSLKDKQ
ncbi:hypothetical protein Mgra_00001671 [Meloidogyne graminicola]|uniref:Uncharacterized protein n=1 Tax=Meloidogyne graminicola TaxID=189291 RepID=A0A8S9ZZX9_9BILA|nr:hypothetical protein Mgra_00001671 [Meloidogyne graminicola]